MQSEGIDGVWVSEFESHLPGGSSASDYPYVLKTLNNIRAAATSTGRTWAFMYDTSGQPTSTMAAGIETQWENMVNSGYTSDPRYLHMNGLPVIMLYGFFPNDTNHNLGNPTYGNPLIQFFQAGKYQAFVVGSGAWNWTTGDSAFQDMLFTLGAYIPWNVGHVFTATNGNIEAQTSTWASDAATFKTHNVKYIPLVFPGTSAAGPPVTNPTAPRRDGYFLWEQYVAASTVGGLNSVFVAMYDEVNEGTAIMPISNTPPAQSPAFYTSVGYPGDWYEKLTVKGESYLKNNQAVPVNIPIQP
jgi:YD repeat-containing protein